MKTCWKEKRGSALSNEEEEEAWEGGPARPRGLGRGKYGCGSVVGVLWASMDVHSKRASQVSCRARPSTRSGIARRYACC